MRRLFVSMMILITVCFSLLAQPAGETTAETVRVAALKGPTAMGLVQLMDESEKGAVNGNEYEFSIVASPSEMTPMLVRGDVDIAAIPANLASVLYGRTNGKIEVVGINTLGVLYIVENGDTVHSVEDLRGRTIYSAGKGATPEYALQYVLASNGLKVGKDVYIEWKSEHAECVAALKADPEGVAMLPQPFATTAVLSNPDIRIALDLNDIWEEKVGSVLITGVTIARKDWIDDNPEALAAFLESYKESVDYANSDTAGAAALIGKYGIVPEKVAKIALPYCQVTLVTGEEMKTALSNYLSILYSQNPQSTGGQVPDDGFYYTGE